MISFSLEVEEDDFLHALAAVDMDVARKLALTMEQVGWEVISFLRSVGHGLQAPARPGEPNRSAHPGNWADVTGNLANAYRFELYAGGNLVRWVPEAPIVSEGGTAAVAPVTVQGSLPSAPGFPIELRFLNGMEYAAALEEKDGYWVIREITERGGPVARALRTVLRSVAPEAEIDEGWL